MFHRDKQLVVVVVVVYRYANKPSALPKLYTRENLSNP